MSLRKPTLHDVPAMVALMRPAVLREALLPRTALQVTERLRDYIIAEEDGELVGVGSLGLVDTQLAEIGALASASAEVERSLLNALIDEARQLGATRSFVLTQDGHPFEKAGWSKTSLDALPEKRDRQCLRCSRLPRCRQIPYELDLDVDAAAAK